MRGGALADEMQLGSLAPCSLIAAVLLILIDQGSAQCRVQLTYPELRPQQVDLLRPFRFM